MSAHGPTKPNPQPHTNPPATPTVEPPEAEGPDDQEWAPAVEVEIHSGGHATTGTETTAGQTMQTTGPRAGGTVNPNGQPTAGATDTSSATSGTYQQTTTTGNVSGSSTNTSSASTKATTTRSRNADVLGGGAGLDLGGSLNLWLNPRFGMAVGYDALWSGSSATLLGAAIPTPADPASLGLSADGLSTTVTVASASAAGNIGPNSLLTSQSGHDTEGIMAWSWNVGGAATYNGQIDNGLPLQIYKERLDSGPTRQATPSVGDFPLDPGKLTGTNTLVNTNLKPGPQTQAVSYLAVTRNAGLAIGPAQLGGLTYAPSFGIPGGIRGTDGNLVTALSASQSITDTYGSKLNFVFNSADNYNGVASGSTAFGNPAAGAAAPLINAFPMLTGVTAAPNVLLVSSNGPIRLAPSEASTGSAAANLDPTVTYTGKGKVLASTLASNYFGIGTLLGRFIPWSLPNGHLWVNCGLAMPTVSRSTVTTVKLVGDSGSGEAHQTVQFTQKVPTATNTDTNRVTAYDEETDISATETVTTTMGGTMIGPMFGLGGEFNVWGQQLVAHWGFAYSPVLGGVFTGDTSTHGVGHQKTIRTTTVATFVNTAGKTTQQGSATDTQTNEVNNAYDDDTAKNGVPAQTIGVGGTAAIGNVGVTLKLGPLAVGLDCRDEMLNAAGVTSPNNLGLDASAGWSF